MKPRVVAACVVAQMPIARRSIPGRCARLPRRSGARRRPTPSMPTVLALFGARVQPVPRALPDAETQALAALVARRRQLLDMLARRAAASCATRRRGRCARDLRNHIRWLERRVADVDDEIAGAIQRSAVWRVQEDLLRSVPGIGPTVARTLLAELPELGRTGPTRHRGLGRRRAVQSGQRALARPARHLGWARAGARRALHGRPRRHAPQPRAGAPSISACAPRASPPKSPSSPSCASC